MFTGLNDVVDYLRIFHRPWSESPGLDPAEIPGDLPDGLALLYREFGALIAMETDPGGGHRLPFAAQDCLMPLDRLGREGGMVEFAWENQGNWSCRSPLGPGDPPVYSNAAGLWRDEAPGYVEVCGSLDRFLATLSLQEAVMSCRNLYAPEGDLPPAAMAALEPLWLGGKYVFDEPSHDFFGLAGTDALLVQHAHTGTFLGSPSISDGGEFHRKAGLRVSRLG